MRHSFLFGLLFLLLGWPASVLAFQVKIEPAELVLVEGQTAVIDLLIDTEGETINLVETFLAFSFDKLSLGSVSRGGSIFPFWLIDPMVDQRTGAIRLVAGLAHPGFNGQQGLLARLTLQALKSGSAALEVLPVSTAYLNDGLGTPRLLSAITGLPIEILSLLPRPIIEKRPPLGVGEPIMLPAPREELAPGLEEIIVLPPVVSSPTHPDSSTWYPRREVILKWAETIDSRSSFVLDQQRDTIPDQTPEKERGEVHYSEVGDGIWYFHLRLNNDRAWSEATHFRLQIDATPPRPFNLTLIKPTDFTEDQYALAFFSTDETSGLDYWEIREPGRVTRVSQSPYMLAHQTPGIFRVLVQAIDLAGNKREQALMVYIPFPPGMVLRWTITSVIMLWVAVLLYQFLIRLLKRERLI